MPRARKTTTAKRQVTAAASAPFTCPECGKKFARAAALGAHRSRMHGVAGRRSSMRADTAAASGQASATRRSGARAATSDSARNRMTPAGAIDRDSLLQALFPNGLPPREAVIREANAWLEQAERLAAMR